MGRGVGLKVTTIFFMKGKMLLILDDPFSQCRPSSQCVTVIAQCRPSSQCGTVIAQYRPSSQCVTVIAQCRPSSQCGMAILWWILGTEGVATPPPTIPSCIFFPTPFLSMTFIFKTPPSRISWNRPCYNPVHASFTMWHGCNTINNDPHDNVV